jgi:hypothetical protein
MLKYAWLPLVGLVLTGLTLAAFGWPGVSLAGENHHGKSERIMSPVPQTTLTRSVKLPPLDTAAPAKTETATFALG